MPTTIAKRTASAAGRAPFAGRARAWPDRVWRALTSQGAAWRDLARQGIDVAFVTLLLILLALVSVVVLAVVESGTDLAIASLFFDAVKGRFPAASDPLLQDLRSTGYASVIGCVALMIATLVVKWLLPSRRLLIPGRATLFLALTLAIGPGILINGIFKSYWGRPRPVEVSQFGGTKPFVPWWSTSGTCANNCSFASGEAATAAWMFGPAILVPPPWRAAALAAAGVFTITMSVLRMSFGGHFLTDVLFGILMTGLVIWTMHGLIYRWPRTRLDETGLDRWLERTIRRIRRDPIPSAKDGTVEDSGERTPPTAKAA